MHPKPATIRAMSKTNLKNAGFSLIELLFAMVFLTIIVLGVIKLQTSNLTLSHTKQLELKAHSYAQQGLEIVDALGKAKIKSDCLSKAGCYLVNSGSYSIASGSTEDPEAGLPGAGLFERSFEYSEDGLENDAVLVTMTVAWTDSSGDHSISAKRVISN